MPFKCEHKLEFESKDDPTYEVFWQVEAIVDKNGNCINSDPHGNFIDAFCAECEASAGWELK